MRIPRVHDLTLGYCEHFGLELRPVRDGQSEGPRPRRRPADDRRAGRPRTRRAWLRGRRARARPLRVRPLGRRHAGPPGAGRARPGRRLGRDRRASTTATRCASSCELKGFSEGAIEMYGVMNFVEAGINNAVVEELREDFGKAYVDMQEIVGGIGPPAERVLSPSCRTDPLRRRGPRASTRTPTSSPSTSRPRPGATRSTRRLRHRARIPFSVLRDGRGHDAVLAREAARDPPAQLLRLDEDPVPGPRADLGGPTTASTAARP